MKILLVTWWFPPSNATACARVYSFAEGFARDGHHVTVITSEKSESLHGDLSMQVELDPKVTVVEVPVRVTRAPVGKMISWMLAARPHVVRHARISDALVTSFMPWHVQMLGWAAKRANPRLFWCADYRDLWSDYDFYTVDRPVKKWVMRRIERAVVGRHADLATTVSEPLAASLGKTLPGVPTETVYNGFLTEEYRPDYHRPAGPIFTIVYTGQIYDGYHDAEPLFRALAAFEGARPVKAWFYGPCARRKSLHDLRAEYGLEGVVELPEAILNRRAALAAQRDADLLLHLSWTNPEVDGVLSGKVFEYLAAGRPILSIGSPPDSAIGKLLAATGCGICVGLDDRAVGQVLDTMVNGGRAPSWFTPDEDAVLAYSRERQARKLLSLLRPGAPAPHAERELLTPRVP